MARLIRSRNRVLHILQLFDRHPVWTVEATAREMGISASSAYRDVQELCQTGFLDPVLGAGYVLGPAFVQYDRLIRRNDALIRIATPLMRGLLEDTTQRATAVLSRRYRDCVMCVHQEQGRAPHPVAAYERGVAMPLFKGATAKAILAHLDERVLKRMYLEYEAQIRAASGCGSWKEFQAELAAIRADGFAVTISEVTANRVGIAAPVHLGKQVVAALSLVLHIREFKGVARKRFPSAVRGAAEALSATASREEIWVTRGGNGGHGRAREAVRVGRSSR